MILTRSTKSVRRGRRSRWQRSGARPRSGTAASRRPSARIPPSFYVSLTQNRRNDKSPSRRYNIFLLVYYDNKNVIRRSLLLCGGCTVHIDDWPLPHCVRAVQRARTAAAAALRRSGRPATITYTKRATEKNTKNIGTPERLRVMDGCRIYIILSTHQHCTLYYISHCGLVEVLHVRSCFGQMHRNYQKNNYIYDIKNSSLLGT